MECKICNRERPTKFFPKRVIEGTGQVLKICSDCDPVDIKHLAEEVAKRIDVEVDCDSYLRVR
jgi:hypothetical protein